MHPQERKISPYTFYGQTTSLCETCLVPVPTKILFENDNVYYKKRCKDHGDQKTLVSTDVNYFKKCKDFIKPSDRPHRFQSKTEYGCPLDCGLCPDHEQHSCLALIEVNEQCNLKCPVCFADSSPNKKTNLSLEEINSMLDTLVDSEGLADVVQLSGGEPTIHPQIFEILELAKTKNIKHLMINTNGVRIAKEKNFAEKLKKFAPGFEVYLQFDSLKKDALVALRGMDLTKIRLKALENLEANNISTTLVVTVKKGLNDDEIGPIIDFALKYKCIRGVTFQPIQDAGRNTNFDKNTDRFLLSDIRRAIVDQSSHFSSADVIPLPCNPESIAIAYALRDGENLQPVTSLLPEEDLLEAIPNAVSFEKNQELRKKIVELFSLSSGDLNTSERMQQLLCCLPEIPEISKMSYENIFRVSIVQFLDKYNFCVGNVKRSCIHFVTKEQQIIPFDTYNLMYRNDLVDSLRAKVGR